MKDEALIRVFLQFDIPEAECIKCLDPRNKANKFIFADDLFRSEKKNIIFLLSIKNMSHQ